METIQQKQSLNVKVRPLLVKLFELIMHLLEIVIPRVVAEAVVEGVVVTQEAEAVVELLWVEAVAGVEGKNFNIILSFI